MINSLKVPDFVSIATGKPYHGTIPSTVSVARSNRLGRIVLGVLDVKTVGEPGYDDALDSWMMRRGYIRKTEHLKELVLECLKGGKGSGYFGHAGRPGKRGGSAPKSGGGG